MQYKVLVNSLFVITLFISATTVQSHDYRDSKTDVIAEYPRIQREKDLFSSIEKPAKLPLEGVLDSIKLWPVGHTIVACFDGGGIQMKAFFVQTTKAWTDISNIKIDYGTAPGFRKCDFRSKTSWRIAFRDAGSYSYIGVDSAHSSLLKKPSLNIGYGSGKPFNTIRKDILRSHILHETGHALGLLHEHQNPKSNCEQEMDWKEIYRVWQAPPVNWTKQKINRNMRQLTSAPRLQTTDYDRTSIMHYSLPPWMFKNGKQSRCWVPEPTQLSSGDKKLIRAAYPKDKPSQKKYLVSATGRIGKVLGDADLNENSIEKILKLAQEISGEYHPNLKLKIDTVTTHGEKSPVIMNNETKGDLKIKIE